MLDTTVDLGPVRLATPLIAACGSVGSVSDFGSVADLSQYGAAVAKSVSAEPWTGHPPPRLAPLRTGMLNAVGIQNPGIADWSATMRAKLHGLPVPVWGSAVGHTPEEFATVATGLEAAGVSAIEVNLSCPNLNAGRMFAHDAEASAAVLSAVRASTKLPLGAKLAPDTSDIVEVAQAVVEAGADWVVLTNTIQAVGFDIDTRAPLVSNVVGGYSGAGLKPIAMRCVWEVHKALPTVPIVGCGGVSSAADVAEYMLAGAAAVAVGTAHFTRPRIARRINRDLRRYCTKHGVQAVRDLIGAATP